MKPYKSSIKRKVMRVIMLTSIATLLITVTAFMIYDLVTFRQGMVQNLATQARIIADNSTAALAFQDENDAMNVLASLRSEPQIIAAALYDAQGKLFAKYPAQVSDADLPGDAQPRGHQFEKSHLTLFEPVIQSQAKLGTLYLKSDVTALSQRLQLYVGISLFIMAGSLLIALWLSITLQRRISNPIIALAETARAVSGQQDFAVRATKSSDDELGDLTDAFNSMLDQIQTSHADLEKSRAQLQIITDYASVMLCQVDGHQVFKFVNPAYAARFNLTPQQVVGRTVHDLLGTRAYESFQHYMVRALAGERVEFELEIPYEKIGLRWMHCIYVPEKNRAGEVLGFVGMINDITARKQAAEALCESERRERERAEELFVMINATPTPVIIVHDRDARHMTGNRAADMLLKVPDGGEISMTAPENLKPRHFKSFKDGCELRPEELPAQRAARGEPVKDFEFDLMFDDGTVLNLLGSGTPLLDDQGQPRGAVHTLVDITEQKRHEVNLAKLMQQADAQARLFDATLSSIQDLAYTFDLEGNWIYANKPLLQLWGKSFKEIIGKSSLELGYAPELAERLKQQVKEVVATRQPVSGETYYTDAAGVEDYHEYIFSPVLAADGTVTAVCGTTRLTTERKRAESLLRQNEALFSALVEQAPNGVYVVDGQFRLQQINARALPTFAKVEPKIGRDFGEVMEVLWGAEVGAQLAGIFRHTLATGEPYRSPRFAEHRHDLDEEKAYEWETQRITLPDGTHGVVCYFNDITEIERHNANLAFLATISDDLLRLDTVDDILNTVCAKICDYLRLTIGCFVEINEAADTSNVTHEWRRPETPGLLGTYKLSEYLSSDFQKVLRAGGCFIVRDTDADARVDAENYAALKIRSFICVPLIADGRWKFMFDIHDSKPRDWREDEISLVRELTARIWARLERVRADSLVRQNEALFAALIEEAPVGVYVVNEQFRLQQINTRALPAFEKVEPKMGRTLTEVMHIQWGKEAGDELAAIFRHTLDTGEPYISPGYSNLRADIGEEKTYEWQTRRVTLPDGQHGVVCYFNDVTEQRREARASQQLAAIVESSADAIISKDLNSIITSWNHAAERLFGFTAKEAIGQPITILLPPERLSEEPNILERIRRGERIERYETVRQRKDGKRLEISLTISPIKDADGKVIGASKIARDVTEQKQAARELARAHNEAVAASRAKDDFLAALSHELRTPLNPVLLLASEAAEDPELPAAVRAQFATIRNNVELEARLIDDLLDITRVTHGKLSLAMDWLDVNAVLHTALATVSAELDKKRISLNLNLAGEPLTLKGDAVRLQQVFWNVIKNAVKFTPEGGKITIETFTTDNGKKTTVKLTDTGIGMTVEELGRIFKAFSQGNHAGNGGSHRFGGLGLGLSISRMLVELHGGKISATSAGLGQGATFVIELPLLKAPAGDGSSNFSDASIQAGASTALKKKSGLRILLVEDHEATRIALEHLLVRRGYKVISATSVAEARTAAQRDQFDLVVSDIGLPDGDGYILMSELREQFGLKGIALTGYGTEQDVSRAQNSGFVAHLTKPIRIEALEKALGVAG
jgi:PAS domain S-box-containing protein